jgi:DNA modification methylase
MNDTNTHAQQIEAQVKNLPLICLKPYPTNARKHSKAQVRQIADSITAFGFTNPVLIDSAGTILAGHGRFEAAKLLGLPTVPTLRIDHLTEAQKKAYVIADNRLAERSGWDKEILAIEFQELMTVETNFNLDITGFDLAEIELMVNDLEDRDPDEGDEVPEPPVKPVSRLGDCWQLGDHGLTCGDSLDPAIYDELMMDERANVVFTDPPYNVPIAGHVSGLGKVQHEEFAMASGEMSEEAFTGFLTTICGHLARHSADGAIQFICMDWRHMRELLAAGEANDLTLKNLCVWSKDNGGMGALYRSQHELVFVFKHGTAAHINNVELGRHGRYRTNVWHYRGANSLRRGRDADLAMHPTVKPVRMVADALLDCSNKGDVVLDPFGGSGTTLIAAEKTGRRARLIELAPRYVDVTIARWQKLTGKEATLADTGQTFTEVAKERSDDQP